MGRRSPGSSSAYGLHGLLLGVRVGNRIFITRQVRFENLVFRLFGSETESSLPDWLGEKVCLLAVRVGIRVFIARLVRLESLTFGCPGRKPRNPICLLAFEVEDAPVLGVFQIDSSVVLDGHQRERQNSSGRFGTPR